MYKILLSFLFVGAALTAHAQGAMGQIGESGGYHLPHSGPPILRPSLQQHELEGISSMPHINIGGIGQPLPKMTDFTTESGKPSTAKIFVVTVANSAEVPVITAPAGFEVSLLQGSGYSSSVKGSRSESNSVWIRMTGSKPTANSSTVGGEVIISAADVSTPEKIHVEGTIR